MPLPTAFPDDLNFSQFRRALEAHEDEQPFVRVMGVRADGTTSHVRFRPTRAIHVIQYHVQSTAAGEGGATYDPASYTSTEEVECNAIDNRVVDRDVTRDGASQYFVFLIPIIEQADGTTLLCDGVSGPDLMSFIDLGV